MQIDKQKNLWEMAPKPACFDPKKRKKAFESRLKTFLETIKKNKDLTTKP